MLKARSRNNEDCLRLRCIEISSRKERSSSKLCHDLLDLLDRTPGFNIKSAHGISLPVGENKQNPGFVDGEVTGGNRGNTGRSGAGRPRKP